MKEDIIDALKRLQDIELVGFAHEVVGEAIQEIERLREIEWIYNDLCK